MTKHERPMRKNDANWSFGFRHSSLSLSVHFADIRKINGLSIDVDFVRAFGVVVGVDLDGDALNDASDVAVVRREGLHLAADEAAGGGQTLLCLDGLERAGQLIGGGDGTELADLLHELRVVHG